LQLPLLLRSKTPSTIIANSSPADARPGLVAMDHLLQARTDGDKELIAGAMTLPVVDRLEIIEVHEQHAYATVARLQPRQALIESILNKTRFGKTGQRIVKVTPAPHLRWRRRLRKSRAMNCREHDEVDEPTDPGRWMT